MSGHHQRFQHNFGPPSGYANQADRTLNSLQQSAVTQTRQPAEDTSPQAALDLHAVPQFEILDAVSLPADVTAFWARVRSQHAVYRSPFFASEFTQAVARTAETQVSVATVRRAGTVTALLPIQVVGQVAKPAGLGINDAHGLIADERESLSVVDVVKGAGLRSYEFHASPPEMTDSERYEAGRTRSFLADLTVDPLGYEHYLREHSTTIDRQGQKTRRMIREQGPLRFEFDCRETDLLDMLIHWKCEQYQRTHTYNILGVPWIQQLMHDLHSQSRGGLHGILNVLYAGETPVAMHYGMLDSDLLHYWFPVFDPKYGYGSPGTQLFLEVVKKCESLGVRNIDMGYGEQRYKHKLTNVITEMSYGLADSSSLRRNIYAGKLTARARLKKLPGREAIKPLARRLLPGWGGDTYGS